MELSPTHLSFPPLPLITHSLNPQVIIFFAASQCYTVYLRREDKNGVFAVFATFNLLLAIVCINAHAFDVTQEPYTLVYGGHVMAEGEGQELLPFQKTPEYLISGGNTLLKTLVTSLYLFIFLVEAKTVPREESVSQQLVSPRMVHKHYDPQDLVSLAAQVSKSKSVQIITGNFKSRGEINF